MLLQQNIPRRVRARIFGNIIEAVGHLQYKVLWDDGVSREPHFSNSLRKESSVASFLPDLRPPRIQDNPELPPQDELSPTFSATATWWILIIKRVNMM